MINSTPAPEMLIADALTRTHHPEFIENILHLYRVSPDREVWEEFQHSVLPNSRTLRDNIKELNQDFPRKGTEIPSRKMIYQAIIHSSES